MQYETFFDDFLQMLNKEQRGILKKVYDILLSNIGLDYQQDISVANEILVVGDSPLSMEFCNYAKDKFKILTKPYINSFNGTLGDFIAIFENEIIQTSQIVFFTKPPFLDSKALDSKVPQIGIHFANDYKSADAIINVLNEFIGDFTYENTILYDKNRCQYYHRDKNEYSYCYACESICPTFAITKNDNLRELRFSNIDCIFCGKCVSVCPSGAMQKANATLTSISKAINLYEDKIPLVINFTDLEDSKNAKNIANAIKNTKIMPFILPNINMLNEVYLLSILQTSGKQCIIYGKAESILCEAVAFINDLYNKIFSKTAVYILDDLKDSVIKDICSKNITFPTYHYNPEENEFSREIFASRVSFLIKDNDYGILKNTPKIKYTNLNIQSDKCTLCMSCVESCNTKALINSKDNFSILLNPSICTACGLCVDICPEHIIEMPLDGMKLNNTFFRYETKAKDEPFRCVECGKIFASTKSIKKVESIMLPIFSFDEAKKRSLLCCSDCKVKVMFKANV
ncbi:hypothetical protein CCY99_08705 [Helicobacter sp. 16-1353]|uniref:4Fe-4S binding protein n=1 Tax=Helicobacter sp. 16-1353 TaxID=2004996 RepID=UPI000DCC4249|nr:4Fe-4S binding protein [Helicobacter sp. 16-1353]RAX51633.1 hypothetical protein CCY99_08705 [Helicobacter sp. 16-1353]